MITVSKLMSLNKWVKSKNLKVIINKLFFIYKNWIKMIFCNFGWTIWFKIKKKLVFKYLIKKYILYLGILKNS